MKKSLQISYVLSKFQTRVSLIEFDCIKLSTVNQKVTKAPELDDKHTELSQSRTAKMCNLKVL